MAAVSLTYDDASLDHWGEGGAADQLKAAGLRGTFFVTVGNARRFYEYRRWQRIASDEYKQEVGSHSVTHPCNGDPGIREKFDAERMQKELEESVRFLQMLTGKDGPFTHSYPCGEVRTDQPYYMSKPDQRASLVPMVRKNFFAARATLPWTVVVPDDSFALDSYNMYTVPSVEEENTAGRNIQIVRDAVKKGGWLVLLFHRVDPVEHRTFLDYLARNKATDKIWVDTFGNVAKYIIKRPYCREDAEVIKATYNLILKRPPNAGELQKSIREMRNQGLKSVRKSLVLLDEYNQKFIRPFANQQREHALDLLVIALLGHGLDDWDTDTRRHFVSMIDQGWQSVIREMTSSHEFKRKMDDMLFGNTPLIASCPE